MRINCQYLQRFINIHDKSIIPDKVSGSEKRKIWKELLASIGMETTEVIDFKGQDIFDIEITPNRPDWLSHVGVARDLHAKLPSLKFKGIEVRDRTLGPNRTPFGIHIQDPDDCGRYIGCIVRHVQVKESSAETKALLESLGLRPINNIVDISNLVVMTLGHPIHIFDLDRLQGDEINIRRAHKGEKMMLLDGQQIEMGDDFLVIADGSEPVALAGIMGGEDSGVTGNTSNIFIESAYFNPSIVRKEARKTGIRSDASYRFERGADILIPPDALKWALDLIEDSMGRPLDVSYYHDHFPSGFTPKVITLSKTYPSNYSGIPIGHTVTTQVLTDLGFGLKDSGDHWDVTVPSFRTPNIDGKEDLVEEIIRIHGYERLTSEIPRTVTWMVKPNPVRELKHKMAQHLNSIGFYEAINYIFTSPEDKAFLDQDKDYVQITNPLGKDFSILRQSLFPGLLKNIQLNFNHSTTGVGLFEYGNRFWQEKDEIHEKEMLALCASGEYQKGNWRNRKGQDFDFFVFKSLLFSLFSKLKMSVKLKKDANQIFDRHCSFSVLVGEERIGQMGELDQEIRIGYQLEKPVMLAEFGIADIQSRIQAGTFRMWNIYPSSSRDFSFLMDRDVTYSQLEDAIQRNKPDALEDFTLFDRYQGKGIPGDKISLSMSFSYSHKNRTLKNEEINEMHNRLINRLTKTFDLIQR